MSGKNIGSKNKIAMKSFLKIFRWELFEIVGPANHAYINTHTLSGVKN